MSMLRMWFLDVGHGDCTYLELPNGARMMIDCGGEEDHWPSKMLKHYSRTKERGPVPIPTKPNLKYGIDILHISHPHGDHIYEIEAIHDDIGFFMFSGDYSGIIDSIELNEIDFRHNGQNPAKKFVDVVKRYIAPVAKEDDRVTLAQPQCIIKKRRFINYEKGMDLNELSWFVSFEIGGHKILFTGDMTAAGIRKILVSPQAEEFKQFVKGTTILKVPHHGRENGCSQEMFEAFGRKPLLCIASDEVLNDRNEGTSAISWYCAKTSDERVNVNGSLQERKVLTTRSDKDICLNVSIDGTLAVITNCFADVKAEILGKKPMTV